MSAGDVAGMALEAVGRIHGCVVVHHPVAGRLGDDRRRGDRRALAVSTDHLPVTLSVDSEPIDQQGSVVRQGNSAGKMQAGAGDLAIRLRRLIPALSPIAEANRGEGFGNARFARTIFEQALNAQAVRLTRSQRSLDGVTESELMHLSGSDVLAAAQAVAAESEALPRRSRWRRRIAS